MQPRNWSPLVGKACPRGNSQAGLELPLQGGTLPYQRGFVTNPHTPVMSSPVPKELGRKLRHRKCF